MAGNGRMNQLPQTLRFEEGDSLEPFPVRLSVGSQKFDCRRRVLRDHSTYFRDLLGENPSPLESSIIPLANVTVAVLSTFLLWMSDAQLRYEVLGSDWCLALAEIWVFAEMIGAKGLADRVIEEIRVVVKQHRETPFPSAAGALYVWQHSSPNAELRHLFVKYFMLTSTSGLDFDAYPNDLLNAVLKKLLGQVRKKRTFRLRIERWKAFSRRTLPEYYLASSPERTLEIPIHETPPRNNGSSALARQEG